MSRLTSIVKVARVVIVAVSMIGVTAGAQVKPPDVTLSGRDVRTQLPASAAHASFNTRALEAQLEALFPTTVPDYPRDSLRGVIASRSGEWLARMQGQSMPGMQLDNLAMLSLFANRDEDARLYFAQRLATPKLPLADRIYTIATAFRAFADPAKPERIPHALAYLSKMDAMGDTALGLRISARGALAHLYYRLGMSDSVIFYGTQAITMLARIPFKERRFRTAFPQVAEALAGKPGGRAEIDRLGKLLLDLATPTEAMVRADSSNLLTSRNVKKVLNGQISTARLLGAAVPAIVGHYWFNSTKPKDVYTEQALADGTIRIVQFGDFLCPHCIESLPAMKRISEQYAGKAQVMYVTNTYGYWGVKEATPAEEVAALEEYYLRTRQLKFPIVIWAPERERQEDGDFKVPESPNRRAFFVYGTPHFCIIDGQGRLRRVLSGYIRETDAQLTEILDFLIAEKSK